MTASPRHNLTLTAPVPHVDAAYHYDSLMRIVREVSAAPTSGKALERLQTLLHERYGIFALALEIKSAATQFLPFGDAAAIAAIAAQRIPESQWNVMLCDLKDAAAPPGEMTYVYAHDSPVTRELLEAATAQIALRLGQETLTRRAEEAESRARQRISEVAAIYEIGQAIDHIELSRLLHFITHRTARLLDAQACSLMLMESEAGILRVAASHGLPEEAMDREQKIGEGIAGRVAETEQPMLIAGDLSDPRLAGVALRPEISSSMLVPMKNQDGGILGVLCIRRRQPSPAFQDDDLKLFSVFASQAALAVTNFRLYNDLQHRAQELFKISELSSALISTLNLRELIARVVEEVCTVVGFDRCGLFLREHPGSQVFLMQKSRGYPESVGRNPVREGEGVVGTVAKTKQMVRFDAREPVPEGERAAMQRKGFARSLGVDAFVAVPIVISRSRCVGVVIADNRSRRESISAEQIHLLSAFINQAGIAIENAQIHEELHEKNRNILRLSNYTDSVLQSSLAGILSTDARGVIQRYNRAAMETLQLEAAPFKETTLTDLITRLGLPNEERNILLEMIARVQETGEPYHHAKLTLHPQERDPLTFNVMLSRLPDHGQERAGVVFIFEDVTHEAGLEARIKEMDRLADIGQLAARMAHEVRNALSPIKCAAQMIREVVEEQGNSTEWPDIIIAEVDGLSRITAEMLDFARPTTLDVRGVSLEAFLASAVQRMAAFLDEFGVSVQWDIAPDVPELFADPILLGQVVRNIVMNAAQAMQQGGVLTIGARYDPAGKLFTVRFQDTGVGVPPDQMRDIFRPFVTSKTKGTGLGLPIVQKIVHQHGGQVHVESQPGAGTCFVVLLPPGPPEESMARGKGGEFPE